MTNALSTLRRIWRRPDQHQWSRLERTLPTPDLPTQVTGLEDHPTDGTDSTELRNYLAAQTSQVV